MSALEIILAVLLILSSVRLTVVILMQESRQAGLSGADVYKRQAASLSL